MRREDVPLSGGARLVVMREGGDHYLRLLVLKDGKPTFVTPPLALDPFDQAELARPEGASLCHAGTMAVSVNGDRVSVRLGEYATWGERARLGKALGRIAV